MLLTSRKNLLLGKLLSSKSYMLYRNTWSGLRRICAQRQLQNGSLLSKILGEISLSVGPFSAVSAITASF